MINNAGRAGAAAVWAPVPSSDPGKVVGFREVELLARKSKGWGSASASDNREDEDQDEFVTTNAATSVFLAGCRGTGGSILPSRPRGPVHIGVATCAARGEKGASRFTSNHCNLSSPSTKASQRYPDEKDPDPRERPTSEAEHGDLQNLEFWAQGVTHHLNKQKLSILWEAAIRQAVAGSSNEDSLSYRKANAASSAVYEDESCSALILKHFFATRFAEEAIGGRGVCDEWQQRNYPISKPKNHDNGCNSSRKPRHQVVLRSFTHDFSAKDARSLLEQEDEEQALKSGKERTLVLQVDFVAGAGRQGLRIYRNMHDVRGEQEEERDAVEWREQSLELIASVDVQAFPNTARVLLATSRFVDDVDNFSGGSKGVPFNKAAEQESKRNRNDLVIHLCQFATPVPATKVCIFLQTAPQNALRFTLLHRARGGAFAFAPVLRSRVGQETEVGANNRKWKTRVHEDVPPSAQALTHEEKIVSRLERELLVFPRDLCRGEGRRAATNNAALDKQQQGEKSEPKSHDTWQTNSHDGAISISHSSGAARSTAEQGSVESKKESLPAFTLDDLEQDKAPCTRNLHLNGDALDIDTITTTQEPTGNNCTLPGAGRVVRQVRPEIVPSATTSRREGDGNTKDQTTSTFPGTTQREGLRSKIEDEGDARPGAKATSTLKTIEIGDMRSFQATWVLFANCRDLRSREYLLERLASCNQLNNANHVDDAGAAADADHKKVRDDLRLHDVQRDETRKETTSSDRDSEGPGEDNMLRRRVDHTLNTALDVMFRSEGVNLSVENVLAVDCDLIPKCVIVPDELELRYWIQSEGVFVVLEPYAYARYCQTRDNSQGHREAGNATCEIFFRFGLHGENSLLMETVQILIRTDQESNPGHLFFEVYFSAFADTGVFTLKIVEQASQVLIFVGSGSRSGGPVGLQQICDAECNRVARDLLHWALRNTAPIRSNRGGRTGPQYLGASTWHGNFYDHGRTASETENTAARCKNYNWLDPGEQGKNKTETILSSSCSSSSAGSAAHGEAASSSSSGANCSFLNRCAIIPDVVRERARKQRVGERQRERHSEEAAIPTTTCGLKCWLYEDTRQVLAKLRVRTLRLNRHNSPREKNCGSEHDVSNTCSTIHFGIASNAYDIFPGATRPSDAAKFRHNIAIFDFSILAPDYKTGDYDEQQVSDPSIPCVLNDENSLVLMQALCGKIDADSPNKNTPPATPSCWDPDCSRTYCEKSIILVNDSSIRPRESGHLELDERSCVPDEDKFGGGVSAGTDSYLARREHPGKSSNENAMSTLPTRAWTAGTGRLLCVLHEDTLGPWLGLSGAHLLENATSEDKLYDILAAHLQFSECVTASSSSSSTTGGVTLVEEFSNLKGAPAPVRRRFSFSLLLQQFDCTRSGSF
ncbi:unnamed protein product [Amoebophrya sp. A120]|nr:unnamed protein product [Amoebophrya sp. A120]|eukprot:GSA120T00015212001.1